MTLIVRPDYHAVPILERNGIRWIPPSQAKRQDIRPLRIGILNIMPLGEKYEFNILHPLGLSVLQLEPIWIRLESHNYKSWEPKHVDDIYVTYEEAMRDQPLDGLILTGAPVETIDFEDVYYWEEIKTILSDARKNIPSTLGLCWAGFVMAYLEGVKKLNYDHKLFGVFELKNLAPDHPIMGELDDVFFCPQSRHAGMPDEAMEEASESGRLKLLAYGPEAGYSIFSTTDDRFIAHTGHPEYNANRLAEEAKRDHGNTEVPAPVNFDFNNPLNRWRSHRNIFFAQWVSYCYLKISTHDMAVGKNLIASNTV
ncbi:MAG: homoserine O-succinyltransferase [SAR324 cluster bacterium]|nr:homoserine O-succinyltransferase [SAR324 cluster bacterium]